MSEKKESGESDNGQLGAQVTGQAADSGYWPAKQEMEEKGVKLFTQVVFYDWCKACGICIAFCPKNVFGRNEAGKPVVEQPDECIGCRFCELHCPDFAITISERYSERRKAERNF